MRNVQYKIIVGTSQEVATEVASLLSDDWGLIGQPFVALGKIHQGVIKEKHEKLGLVEAPHSDEDLSKGTPVESLAHIG